MTLHFRKPDGTEAPTLPKTADSGGNYSNIYVTGGTNLSGQYQYWAVDNATGATSNTATFQVTVSPSVSVSPSSGPRGTSFSQPGTGFTSNGSVTLHFRKPDGTEAPTLPKTADSGGNYSNSYQSSAGTQVGTYRYWAVDNATGIVSNTATFTIT